MLPCGNPKVLPLNEVPDPIEVAPLIDGPVLAEVLPPEEAPEPLVPDTLLACATGLVPVPVP